MVRAEASGWKAGEPLHVAAYIQTHPGSTPTVKQHLAAIRMLGDWLVVSQVLPVNPAAAGRVPKYVVTKGATPVLSPAEARKLLEAIDTGTLAGLRDRAPLSVMLYSFARVSAVLGTRRQDYFGSTAYGCRLRGRVDWDGPVRRDVRFVDAGSAGGRGREPRGARTSRKHRRNASTSAWMVASNAANTPAGCLPQTHDAVPNRHWRMRWGSAGGSGAASLS